MISRTCSRESNASAPKTSSRNVQFEPFDARVLLPLTRLGVANGDSLRRAPLDKGLGGDLGS
jgi:hypothetical protein